MIVSDVDLWSVITYYTPHVLMLSNVQWIDVLSSSVKNVISWAKAPNELQYIAGCAVVQHCSNNDQQINT